MFCVEHLPIGSNSDYVDEDLHHSTDHYSNDEIGDFEMNCDDDEGEEVANLKRPSFVLPKRKVNKKMPAFKSMKRAIEYESDDLEHES